MALDQGRGSTRCRPGRFGSVRTAVLTPCMYSASVSFCAINTHGIWRWCHASTRCSTGVVVRHTRSPRQSSRRGARHMRTSLFPAFSSPHWLLQYFVSCRILSSATGGSTDFHSLGNSLHPFSGLRYCDRKPALIQTRSSYHSFAKSLYSRHLL